MSTSSDLMGLGMPGALADRLSNNVATVTAAGTSAGTATALTGNHTYVVAAASSQTGVILSASLSVGTNVIVTCTSSTSAVVYPPSGASFNTSAASSLTLAQYKTALITKLSGTLFSVLLTA
jgi:hypothetical protein